MLIAIPVALYWWLNSDEEPAQVSAVPVRPITKPIRPAEMPAPDAAKPPSPQALTPEAVPAPSPSALPAAAPEAAQTSVPTPPDIVDQTDVVAPVARGTIKLDFEDDAWVEIYEEGGRALLHKLNPAGSSVSLTGTPPFSFIIGNAAHVRMTYNGRPLDLTPYIDIKVARFNLEQ
jgi:cytoskeleton protein RodZ